MEKIIIIEDEPSIRENIVEIFESGGYKVHAAKNGKEGIKLIQLSKPDLIICDLIMPEMDGFEVKKKLSKDKDIAFIPFIFLTAKADIKDFQHAMELGADDYITKPVGAKKLLELVSNRLKRIEELNSNERKEVTKNISITESEKILLKSGKTHILAVINEIIIIRAAGDYSEVLLKSGEKVLIKNHLKAGRKLCLKKHFCEYIETQ